MEKPRITVITLAYRKYDKLARTIKSIFAQDYKNFEYIISDDGSTNYDEDYIRGLIPTNRDDIDVVIMHHKENVGTVENFNKAIEKTTGKYIIVASADDELYNSKVISSIVERFVQHNADIVTTKRAFIDPKSKQIIESPTKERQLILKNGNSDEIFEELCISSFISGSCTAYSKRIIEKYKGFDTHYRLIEDFPFYARAVLDGVKIDFLDIISIYYGIDGVTSGKSNVSVQLMNDRKLFYQRIIFPQLKKMTYLTRKEIMFRYYRICCKDEKVKYLLGMVKSFDIITLLVVRKIKKKFGNNKI